jgi:hypothetical protein
MPKPILCVDFDGVIHSYASGWKGAAVIPDPPVPGAIQWLLWALDCFDVHIYSSRSRDPEGIHAMREWLQRHAAAELSRQQAGHLLDGLRFSYEKPAAFLTIDDRCIRFEGSWGRLNPHALRNFKPWHQRASPEEAEEGSGPAPPPVT